MKMNKINMDILCEMMGDTYSLNEAGVMLSLLSRDCVSDTDEVSEAQWSKYLVEVANIIKNEAEYIPIEDEENEQ
jgi:hypothetical protein